MFYDKDFLLQLDKIKNKTIYARITALTFDEAPIETAEGRVTTGSINVDGNSAVRRTCSLTMVAENFNYQNYSWELNTKFKLEIGVQNKINPHYPNIIWFRQGIFLFTSFSISQSTNGFSISLQGKDKMCLLNGEIGGTLESSIDFGNIEEEDENGIWTITPIPIYDIIRNMIHTYAGEPYHNIIINDLDDYALELLEYRYDIPMYLYRSIDSQIFSNILLNGEYPCIVDGKQKTLNQLDSTELDMLVDTLTGTSNPKAITLDGQQYYVAKISFGQTAGYRHTELTYPGDLIANVGDSITSVLDKIKNMLSEFEYFYDLDGQFVFQRKQSFVNTLWTPIVDNEDNELYVENVALSSSLSYVFNGGELISSFNNNPQLTNLRNDFSVWGMRDKEIPIHMRYAIDTKPKYYKTFDGKTYISDEEYFLDESSIIVDWREIIYQMALDYYKHNTEDEFELRLRENNIQYYPTGQTGYEKYYIDIQGFWRQLYNPFFSDEIEDTKKILQAKEEEAKKINLELNSAVTLAEKKVLSSQLATINQKINDLNKKIEDLTKNQENYYPSGDPNGHSFWNKDVYESPETINFWFDFLDTEGELSQFNVKNIGFRSKAINETSVKSIYFRETPDIIFKKPEDDIDILSGFKYIQVQDIESMFSISPQGKSAKDRLDELIYTHGYCIESATINTIPIYYLQPNTRIHLSDQQTNLYGDYIISKMTIPLTYNGMMSITATKAAESII